MDQFKGQTRLPKFAVPARYDLHLKLDLISCTFSGSLQINLRIVEETRFLVLNALELDIGEVFFTPNSSPEKVKDEYSKCLQPILIDFGL